MNYIDIYNDLKKRINYADEKISLEDADVYNIVFESKATAMLAGSNYYRCETHNIDFNVDHIPEMKASVNEDLLMLNSKDIQIIDNKRFVYHVFLPKGQKKIDKLIIMLHGFNEKTWDKYLPWALHLVKTTGKGVVLFPIAFHMNRAPHLWSSRYEMYELSKKRQQNFPNILYSTLSNVAISIHIHAQPERFIWSGLQTYSDIIQLINQINTGSHPLFSAGSQSDFFAYSIGGLLAKALIMTNQDGFFSNSKLCMFCSGAAFNRVQAASRFIIDSEGSQALYSFLIEHLNHHIKTNPRLAHYLSDAHPEGMNLLSLINYHKMIEHRESKFNELSNRMIAFGLKNDQVYPYYEIKNTLQGIEGNIPVKVRVLDFPYPYRHEDPFPANKKYQVEVNKAFENTFNEMAEFLK